MNIEETRDERIDRQIAAHRELLDRLGALDEKLDEIHARVKKNNSLVGMMVGRLPAPRKKRA